MTNPFSKIAAHANATAARKARRAVKKADNAALAVLTLSDSACHCGATAIHSCQGFNSNGSAASQEPQGEAIAPGIGKSPVRTVVRAKKKRKNTRKSLVKKADTAFSLHIRGIYPQSFFSGKPTECCFHIITRSKHSVRWSLDNGVGSTMGENYEMEFNPHKFISILIQKRGLPWYEDLIRRSNEIKKFSRADLEGIAARGYYESQ